MKGRADKASHGLVDLIDKAFRLLSHHATIISCDSLLIYDSALFTSARHFQLKVARHFPSKVTRYPHSRVARRSQRNVERIGGYPSGIYSKDGYSRGISAISESHSIWMPAFKLCLDFALVLAWSPNSQHIAVSRVNGIEIRDALSGSVVDSFDFSPTLEHVLDPQKVSSRCLAFYPDNSRIAYTTRGDGVHVRNTQATKEEFVVSGLQGGLVSLVVSPNGKFLVSSSKSGRIQVCNAENGALFWDAETGTKLKSTSISPNSQFIVSLSYSPLGGVRIWNANDGHPLSILPHDIISVSFSPDSSQLAGVDEEGLIRFWGTSHMTTEPIHEWHIGAPPPCLSFSPHGSQLAAATGDNVCILHRDTGNLAMLDGHTGPVSSLAFSADGLMFASGSLDGTIQVWDASSIGGRVVVDEQEKWRWERMQWSPLGQVVMAWKWKGRNVWIWNTQDGTSRVLEDCSGLPTAISDCGRYLATDSPIPNMHFSITAISTRGIASDVAQSNQFSHRVASSYRQKFFPNSTRFAAVSYDKIITWDASAAHPEVTSLVGHSGRVDEFYFVSDGSRLLSIAGREVLAWNVDTFQLVSRTGNVIPPDPPIFGTSYNNWVMLTLPAGGGRPLFMLPSEYRPFQPGPIGGSWSSKCIFVKCRRNGNMLIVDFSALPALPVIDYSYVL